MVDLSPTATMFQMPVTIRTPKAVQATWLNRLAAAPSASGAQKRRSTGDEHGQGQLAADPDGRGQDMQEQPDEDFRN